MSPEPAAGSPGGRVSSLPQQFLADAVDAANILVTDLDGTVLFCTSGLCRFYGFSQEEMLGKCGHELLRTELPKPYREIQAELVRDGCWTGDLKQTRRDGASVWISSHRTLTAGSDGGTAVVDVICDITEHKRIEQELRLFQDSLRLAQHAARCGVWAWDIGTGEVYWSDEIYDLFGFDSALKPAIEHWLAAVHPDDRSAAEQQVAEAMKGRLQFRLEFRVPHNGGVRWMETIGSTVCDDEGCPAQITGIVFEITERKQAEEALQRLARERADRTGELQAVLDAAPVAIWIAHDPGCQRVTGNAYADENVMHVPRGTNVSQTAPSGLEPFRFRAFVDGVELRSDQLPLKTAMATSKPVPAREIELRFADDRTAYLLMGAVPLLDSEGRVRGAVAAGTDVTALRQAEEALRKSEQLYRAIGESIDYGVWVCTPDGRNTYASESFLKLVGLTQQQCSDFGWGSVLHPEDAEGTLAAWKECVASGGVWDIEHRCRGVDGQYHSILARGVPVRDERGEITCWAGINLDISRRKAAEDKLREAVHLLNLHVDNSPLAVVEWDSDFRITRWAGDAVRLFGWTAAETLGNRIYDLAWLHPDDKPLLDRLVADTVSGKRPSSISRIRNVRKDGSVLYCEWYNTSIRDASGQLVSVLSQVLNITERKRAGDALRESQQRLALAQQAAHVGVFDWHLASGKVLWTEEMNAIFGIPAGRFEGTLEGWMSRVHPDDRAVVERSLSAWIESGRETEQLEYRSVRPDGAVRWIEACGRLLADSTGHPARVIGTHFDITDRKRVEEALRESERAARDRLAEIEAMYDTAPIGLCVLDTGLRWKRINRRLAEFNGAPVEAHIGRTMREVVPAIADHTEAIGRRVLETGEPVLNVEVTGTLPAQPGVQRVWNGQWVPLKSEAGTITGVTVAVEEITEKKKIEERLRRAQQTESIGVLAGGIAHDFNNLLVGLMGNASLALDMLPHGHPVAELLNRIVRSSEHAAHLTRQMLAYSGKGRFIVEPVDLSEAVRAAAGLIVPSVSRKIDVQLNLAADLPPVEADRSQIQQVCVNLVLNASEAIGENAGTITIATSVRDVTAEDAREQAEGAELGPGRYICLEVADTGCGMDEPTRARIFEPFFTTKFTGRGLGLAAAAGIVRGHKGAIQVTSTPAEGSTFVVLLPAALSGTAKPGGSSRVRQAENLRGAGTVLVVDDEEIVRHMAKASLERHGYKVLVAGRGADAIELVREARDRIDLVLLDMSMPGMDGHETLPELRRAKPGIAVLISSGYSEAETMRAFSGAQVSGFVQKPYTSQQLARKVKAAIPIR